MFEAPRDSTDEHPAPFGVLAGPRPADGTARFTLLVRARPDSAYREAGTMTVSQATLAAAPDTVVRRVIVYDYGARGTVVDTTLSVARSLAPVAERTHKRSGDITLDFTGRTVVGRMGAAGGERAIHDSLPSPAFNSTDLELVVRSLPLRAGYGARLPIYDPEFGGHRLAEVRVIAAARAAWRVEVVDRRLRTVYDVDSATRALLGAEIEVRDRGVAYRLLPRN